MASYDLLMSADIVTSDPIQTAQALEQVLGLPAHRPVWVQTVPERSYQAVFARANSSRAMSATVLEIIAPLHTNDNGVLMERRITSQRDRALVTHATVLATSTATLDDLIEYVRSSGIAAMVEEPCDPLPFRRLWYGVTDPSSEYDSTADAGLMIEVIPIEVLGLPEPQPLTPTEGQNLAKVHSRDYIVADLRRALDILRKNLLWESLEDAHVIECADHLRCHIQFGHAASASMFLVQPTVEDGEAGRFSSRNGPGPYVTRLSAFDLDAQRRRLDAMGVSYRKLDPTPGLPVSRLAIDPARTLGMPFELVGLEEKPPDRLAPRLSGTAL
jgi:hypothetical protein